MAVSLVVGVLPVVALAAAGAASGAAVAPCGADDGGADGADGGDGLSLWHAVSASSDSDNRERFIATSLAAGAALLAALPWLTGRRRLVGGLRRHLREQDRKSVV